MGFPGNVLFAIYGVTLLVAVTVANALTVAGIW